MKSLIRNTLALCLGFGLAASVASMQAGAEMHAKLLKASEVIGAKIFDTKGEHLGEIKDVVFDENKGGIAYGVLSSRGWLGIGDDVSVVPGAPHFPNDSWPDFNDDRNSKTASYYGLQGDKLKGMNLVRASNGMEAKLWDQSAAHISSISDLLVAFHDGKVAYTYGYYSASPDWEHPFISNPPRLSGGGAAHSVLVRKRSHNITTEDT